MFTVSFVHYCLICNERKRRRRSKKADSKRWRERGKGEEKKHLLNFRENSIGQLSMRAKTAAKGAAESTLRKYGWSFHSILFSSYMLYRSDFWITRSRSEYFSLSLVRCVILCRTWWALEREQWSHKQCDLCKHVLTGMQARVSRRRKWQRHGKTISCRRPVVNESGGHEQMV